MLCLFIIMSVIFYKAGEVDLKGKDLFGSGIFKSKNIDRIDIWYV